MMQNGPVRSKRKYGQSQSNTQITQKKNVVQSRDSCVHTFPYLKGCLSMTCLEPNMKNTVLENSTFAGLKAFFFILENSLTFFFVVF